MVILAAADIHGRHEVYDWLVDQALARRPAALVLAGDLFGYPDDDDTVEAAQEKDRERMLVALARLPQPVLYIMGNGDYVELRDGSPRLRSLHGRRVDLGDCNFVGYQCSLPFMGNVNERPESVIAADLEALAPLVDSRTVLVTHVPARGSLDFGLLGRRIGLRPLAALIEQRRPLAHVHGHSHSGFGRCGRHFNVAAGTATRAMLIDLATLEHEVVRNGDGVDEAPEATRNEGGSP